MTLLIKKEKRQEKSLLEQKNFNNHHVCFDLNQDSLKMKWRGGKIANVDSYFDFWDKSDPYLKFLKVRQDNTFIEIART